jgi:hypothetical protein
MCRGQEVDLCRIMIWVPATITIPSGSTFSATAGTVTLTQSVTVTATFGGASKSAAVSVAPAPPPPAPAALKGLTCTPPASYSRRLGNLHGFAYESRSCQRRCRKPEFLDLHAHGTRYGHCPSRVHDRDVRISDQPPLQGRHHHSFGWEREGEFQPLQALRLAGCCIPLRESTKPGDSYSGLGSPGCAYDWRLTSSLT